MGSQVCSTSSCLNLDLEWEPEEYFLQKMLKRGSESNVRLALARSAVPTLEFVGTSRTVFEHEEKISAVWVDFLESVKGWAPLAARYNRADDAARRASAASGSGGSSESGSRQGIVSQVKPKTTKQSSSGSAPNYWKVKLTIEGESGKSRLTHCMMQVAKHSEDRSMEQAVQAIQLAKAVAKLADDFNLKVLQAAKDELGLPMEEPLPGIVVCIPTGCRVIQSPLPQYFTPGDEVLLIPYVNPDVTKFLFDGTEPFQEVAQGFFHFAAWRSGGREHLTDIQGFEDDDGTLMLVDPSFEVPSVQEDDGGLLGSMSAIVSNVAGEEDIDLGPERFDRMHPRCGMLCKSFDPERLPGRTRPSRRTCGLPVTCYTG